MHGGSLLWAFWLWPGVSACGPAVMGKQKVVVEEEEEEAASQLAWKSMALFYFSVLALVLLLGAKVLSKMFRSKAAADAKEGTSTNPEDLERRLVQTFCKMEQDLVKLVTLVRNRKASLAVRHRGCKDAECRWAHESAKDFNMAIYNIVED